jgi:hypothetical protein
VHGKFVPIIIGGLALLALAMLTLEGGSAALALTIIASMACVFVLRSVANDKDFITTVFLAGLLARLAFGLFVHIYDLRDFFGGDANTYDYLGNALMLKWTGATAVADHLTQWELDHAVSGWGMFYFAAGIYTVVGRNILAAQSVCAVFGAAIAPASYFCAAKVFDNKRVAELSAIFAALFPAFVVWSGQLLKDGLMVLLLVIAMTMILSLQEKFSVPALLVLLASITAVLPLRFYVFYALAVSLAASFILGLSTSAKALVRNTVILIILSIVLTYIGVTRSASSSLDQFGTLAVLQNSRRDLATSADSGFGADIDVSTSEGALSALPIGFVYLLFAPFPWQVSSFRAAITEPEVILWWAMMPLMISGIAWSLRHRFKRAFPILMFTLLLSIAYSIFQGNVGTAYRQRTQMQVFCFMFIAVGWTLRKEKRENERLLANVKQRSTRVDLARYARPT